MGFVWFLICCPRVFGGVSLVAFSQIFLFLFECLKVLAHFVALRLSWATNTEFFSCFVCGSRAHWVPAYLWAHLWGAAQWVPHLPYELPLLCWVWSGPTGLRASVSPPSALFVQPWTARCLSCPWCFALSQGCSEPPWNPAWPWEEEQHLLSEDTHSFWVSGAISNWLIWECT